MRARTDPHQLPAQAAIDAKILLRRPRILDVRRGVARAIPKLRDIGVRARAACHRLARTAGVAQAIDEHAAEQRANLLAAGEAIIGDEATVLEGGTGAHDVVVGSAMGNVDGRGRAIGGEIEERADTGACEVAKRDRALLDQRIRAVVARGDEIRILGQIHRQLVGEQLHAVGTLGIVRRFAMHAAVPRELRREVRALPRALVGRDAIGDDVEAIGAGRLVRGVADEPRGARDLTEQRELDVVRPAIPTGARHRRHENVGGLLLAAEDLLEHGRAGQAVDRAIAVRVDELRRAPRERGVRVRGGDAGGVPGRAPEESGQWTGADDRRRDIGTGIGGDAAEIVEAARERTALRLARQPTPHGRLELVRLRAATQRGVDRAAGARAIARREPAGADGDALEEADRDARLGASGAQRIHRRTLDGPSVLEPGRATEARAGVVATRAEAVARDRVVRGIGDRQAAQVRSGQPRRQCERSPRIEGIGAERAAERAGLRAGLLAFAGLRLGPDAEQIVRIIRARDRGKQQSEPGDQRSGSVHGKR